MNVDFKGYDENVATFIVSGNLSEGQFVTIADDYTVEAASSGDEIIGCCVGVRDGYAAVQLSGYVEAKSNGTVNVGLTGLSAYSADTVQASNSAGKHKVIYSDSENNKVGFIL